CQGYSVRLHWPSIPPPTRYFDNAETTSARRRDQLAFGGRVPEGIPISLSPLGLSQREDHLIQHHTRNVARIALAIDYEGNVYRSLVPMAMSNPALLYALLAASSGHLSRCQGTSYDAADRYMKRALIEMERRLGDSTLAMSHTTLAAMLCMISYEVGRGSSNWKHHYEGTKGWIRSKPPGLVLDPFLKGWVFMVALQASLVFGDDVPEDILDWQNRGNDASLATAIDPFLGYSVKLPRIMHAASMVERPHAQLLLRPGELHAEVERLQQQLENCEIDTTKCLVLASSWEPEVCRSVAGVSPQSRDLWRRAGATAEIFRHAAHIYVQRLETPPSQPLPARLQTSVNAILKLLKQVPDSRGPGANLSWPLLVVGNEIDDQNTRQMLLDRWQGLYVLGMESTRRLENVLLESWRRRDMAREEGGPGQTWQQVMHSMGEAQMVA
ncbi:hypothetical protein GQ53DRAFT_651887, partial [Thozetella sp. PMI_491]